MKEIVVIIGAGGQTGRFRNQRLLGKYGLDCSGFVEKVFYVDTNKEAFKKKIEAGEFPADSCFFSLEELARSVDFDSPISAFICTPVGTHFQVLKEVIKLGFINRVLVEKPLDDTIGRAQGMKVIAEGAGIKLFCGYHIGFWEPMTRLHQSIKETHTEIKEVVVTYNKNREAGHKKRHPIPGVIQEEIPHAVDLITSIIGMPRLVTVTHKRKMPIRVGVDRIQYAKDMPGLQLKETIYRDQTGEYVIDWITGAVTVQLSFPEGRTATIFNSFETGVQERSIRVEGSLADVEVFDSRFGKHFITWRAGFTDLREHDIQTRPYFEKFSGTPQEGIWSAPLGERRQMELGDPLGIETQAFLVGDNKKLCGVNRALAIQAVVEAIQASADTVEVLENGVVAPGQTIEVKL